MKDDSLPLVKDSYITVIGPIEEVHKFVIAASPKEEINDGIMRRKDSSS